MVDRNGIEKCSFKDVLEIRRNTSDFMWNSRELHLKKSYNQYLNNKNPFTSQNELLKSERIQQLIEEVSKNSNDSKEEVRQRVIGILNEIGHTRHIPVFRCVGLCFTKLLKKVISSVYVNEKQVVELRSEMGKNPVIFLPSHRSYADFLLMSYIAFHYEIEVPCIAAGMDFQSMWMVGKLLRDCNAFFMRRSFGDDKLYRTIFKEYVQYLVIHGDAPVEFFIEGTRSRSAKALVPKFGLLTMLLEPFFNGEVPDITLVPVSFSYERVLEEALFSYEMLGVPKPRESTSGLIKALKILDEKYGNVHANFGQPISLRTYLTKNLGCSMDFTKRDIVKECNEITSLGYHIVDCQQKNMVLNAFNLFAIVFGNHLLIDSQQPLMIEQASKDVAWLSAVLSSLGAIVQPISHGSAVSIVTSAISLHQSLVKIAPSGSVHLVKVNNENCGSVDEHKLKGHKLGIEVMNLAVPMFMLQQYINPCLHFLVNPAIITLIMQHLVAVCRVTKNEVFKKYQFIRELFAHEFVFFKPWEVQEFEDALAKLELLSIIENDPLRLGNHQKLQALLSNLLYPFFSAYLSVCRLFQTANTNVWTERELLRTAQQKIEEELCCGWVLHPYCLSLDVIASCISALTSMTALSRKRIGTEVHYTVNKECLTPIIEELESLINVPQRYQKKEQINLENTEPVHVISPSEPIQRLVSKL